MTAIVYLSLTSPQDDEGTGKLSSQAPSIRRILDFIHNLKEISKPAQVNHMSNPIGEANLDWKKVFNESNHPHV